MEVQVPAGQRAPPAALWETHPGWPGRQRRPGQPQGPLSPHLPPPSALEEGLPARPPCPPPVSLCPPHSPRGCWESPVFTPVPHVCISVLHPLPPCPAPGQAQNTWDVCQLPLDDMIKSQALRSGIIPDCRGRLCHHQLPCGREVGCEGQRDLKRLQPAWKVREI